MRFGFAEDAGERTTREPDEVAAGVLEEDGGGGRADGEEDEVIAARREKGHKEYLRNYMELNPRTYVSSKGYSFTKKTEVLLIKITPLSERVEVVEVAGEAMEE